VKGITNIASGGMLLAFLPINGAWTLVDWVTAAAGTTFLVCSVGNIILATRLHQLINDAEI